MNIPGPGKTMFASGRFKVAISAIFAAHFAVLGVYLPFLPVWLSDRGLSAFQISAVWAIPLAAKTLAAPWLAYGIDRQQDRRKGLLALLLVSSMCAVALHFSHGFAVILGVVCVLSLLSSLVPPVSDAYAMSGVRAAGLSYGRLRLWGSVSFLLASLAAGWLVQSAGPTIVPGLIAAGMAAAVMAVLALPGEPPTGRAAEPRTAMNLSEAARLVARPAILSVFLAGGLSQASHAMIYTLGSVHWRLLGLSAGLIGLLWAIGVAAEIALFIWSSQAVRRLGAHGLLLAAGIAGTLRWGAMAFDPAVPLLVVLQLLHGLTFGAAHLAIVHYVSDAVPARYGATVQSSYAALAGGLMGAMMLLSGGLYELSGAAAYWAMAAAGTVAAAIAAVAMVAARRGD